MPSFNCPDCGTSIPGTNCAHELSRQKRWKKIPGCYAHCKCGYPVRAKELRNSKFAYINNDESSTTNAFIYCENGRGQGHVYYGTFAVCANGNGYTAKQMKANNNGQLSVFSRNNEK